MFIDVLFVWCLVKFDWTDLASKILLDNPQLGIKTIFQIFNFIFASLNDLVKHFQRLVDLLNLFSGYILIIYSPFSVFLLESPDLGSEILT